MRVADLVDDFAVRRLHAQFVANTNVPERAELLIAMRRDCAVALLPRARRIGKMAGSAIERIARVAFDDRGRKLEPRDFQQADEIRPHRRILDRCLWRLLDLCL